MRPADCSFSTELTDLFKRIGKLEKSLDELQARLRDELEAPNLSLDRNQRGAHVVTVKGKLQLGKIERSGSFHSVNESRSSKTFAYSVSSYVSTTNLRPGMDRSWSQD